MHSTNYYNQNGMNKFHIDDVPKCLQKYLITIDQPHESYEHVSRVHDQRIRLLLRRFTNQIQFGCKNPYCTVPTCLSYRKRHATRPVRTCIDVATQALAAQCVERCISNASLDEIFRREKGKQPAPKPNRKATSRKTGLCYSEPVVPWYSHPDDLLRRGTSGAQLRSPYQNGSLKKPVSGQLDHDLNGSTQPRSAAHAQNRERSPSSRLPAADLQSLHSSLPDPPVRHSSPSFQQTLDTSQNDAVKENHNYLERDFDSNNTRQRKKDHASFTQWLFDTEELRAYGNVQSCSASEMEDADEVSAVHVNSMLDKGKASEVSVSISISNSISDNEKVSKEISTAQPALRNPRKRSHYGYTLRLLPTSAVLWLRRLLQHSPQLRDSSLPSQTLEDNRSSSNKLDILRFIRQCIFFTFSDPQRLMISASSWEGYSHDGPESITETTIEDHSRTDFEASHQKKRCLIPKRASLEKLCQDLLLLLSETTNLQRYQDGDAVPLLVECMLAALRQCYQCPSFADPKRVSGTKYYSNPQVAHLILLTFNLAYGIIRKLNDMDELFSAYVTMKPTSDWSPSNVLHARDDELAANPQFSHLFTMIASLINHRVKVDMTRQIPKPYSDEHSQEIGILSCLVSMLGSNFRNGPAGDFERVIRLLKVMQAVVCREWNRQPCLRREGPTVGALELLSVMHNHRSILLLPGRAFQIASVGEDLDEIDAPFKWLSYQPDINQTHILEYSFLFTPTQILKFFRSINLKVMKQSHERAMAVYAHAKTELVRSQWRVNGLGEILEKTRAHMARYFVMTISRETLLEDAIGQIWRRERQELLRPLKVRIGKREGEEGIDHGGVQQEFFRLVFAEAFDPKYGMFDVDPTTHMAWFKPGSLEPTYKFEAFGILMGLAIFNGVTVPITMPLAFYKKILGIEVLNRAEIEDGWPELYRSFLAMLNYEGDDVGDAISRTYEFAYEAFGTIISIDMTRTKQGRRVPPDDSKALEEGKRTHTPHGDPSDTHARIHSKDSGSTESWDEVDDVLQNLEAPLVTNANREAYVLDYVNHLLNLTVKDQFGAFLCGLHKVLSPHALTLFSHSPKSFKLLVEGHPLSQPLELDEWVSITTYDEYEPSDPLIVWFWEVLREDLDQIQLRKLLEFVTACNRIPVNGWEGVTFLIQKNGEGDERLPTSSTCYGRLLLPNYSSKSILKQKLEKAIENSLGFGAL